MEEESKGVELEKPINTQQNGGGSDCSEIGDTKEQESDTGNEVLKDTTNLSF